jgi:hypothetical protein
MTASSTNFTSLAGAFRTPRMAGETDPKITGIYAGTLSLAEIGLGSILHGMRVPFAGTFLSINQAVFLTRLVKLNRENDDVRTLPLRVSNVTAMLKSLSPAGKKLLPMLAIAAQGLLFTTSVLVLGPGLAGCVAGGMFLSVWGVVQPLAIMWLIYGTALGAGQIDGMIRYYGKLMGGFFEITPSILVQMVLAFLVAKALVAGVVCFAAWRAGVDEQKLLNDRLVKIGLRGFTRTPSPPAPSTSSAWVGAARDLRRPVFLLPLCMTGLFFWFSEHQLAPVVWGMLRPLAFAYIVFLALRLFPLETWVKRRSAGSLALASAIEFLNRAMSFGDKDQRQKK